MWVCQSHETRALIPSYYRSDCMPANLIQGSPESTPSELKQLVEKSFEGRSWLTHMVQAFRSRANFTDRVTMILKRAGITPIILEDSTFEEKELTDMSANFRKVLKLVAREWSCLIAENLPEALLSNRKQMNFAQDRTVEEIAGDEGLGIWQVRCFMYSPSNLLNSCTRRVSSSTFYRYIYHRHHKIPCYVGLCNGPHTHDWLVD